MPPCELCPHCKEMAALNAEAECDPVAILEAVSERYKIPKSNLLNQDRTQRVALARHICFYLTRKQTTMTFPAIAKMYRHDHSSVIHGWNKIARLLLERPAFANEIAQLRARIESREAA